MVDANLWQAAQLIGAVKSRYPGDR
jgi:hypothetical protein